MYNARIVALRKESVDRNILFLALCHMGPGSLSARRAWIEILFPLPLYNYIITSLSARRAWIEIGLNFARKIRLAVALRKESVDRNGTVQIVIIVVDSRSPQGERG